MKYCGSGIYVDSGQKKSTDVAKYIQKQFYFVALFLCIFPHNSIYIDDELTHDYHHQFFFKFILSVCPLCIDNNAQSLSN